MTDRIDRNGASRVTGIIITLKYVQVQVHKVQKVQKKMNAKVFFYLFGSGNGIDNILLLILFFFSCSSCRGVGRPLQKDLRLRRFKSDGMKHGRNVLQIKTHRLTSQIFDMTSYFQDGGHNVI